MADLLVEGVGQLVTNDPGHGGRLGIVNEGAVVIEDGVVAWAGPAAQQPEPGPRVPRLDVDGAAVIPGFVDCHTHVAFAGDRSDEFAMRLGGAAYQEIMDAGGGIVSTVRATRAAADDALYEATAARVQRMLAAGTTTAEIKSGYGLDPAAELRLLEVIARVDRESPLEVIPTFLGAHAVPPEYADDREAYVRTVIEAMLPSCAPLARFCDVFCDVGAFTVDEARRILVAAAGYGLGTRLHAEQLATTGAAALAAELGAASADHLDHVDREALEAMAAAGTVAVLLPGVSLSMRLPFPDAGAFREAGVAVAIATDANPGTSYVLTMQLIVALACLEMGMSPDEALWSATRGGARALGLERHGMLATGSPGDLVVLDGDSHVHLAYRPGENLARHVVKRGRIVAGTAVER